MRGVFACSRCGGLLVRVLFWCGRGWMPEVRWGCVVALLCAVGWVRSPLAVFFFLSPFV